MTCPCGEVMSCDAGSKEEGVQKMKAMMNESAVAAHMAAKHPGEPALSMADVHGMIDQKMQCA